MENKKIKEGKYTLEQAQQILGACYLAEVPEMGWETKTTLNYGSFVAKGFWRFPKQIGTTKVWMTPAGLYVEAEC